MLVIRGISCAVIQVFSPPCMSFPIPLKGHHLQYLTAAVGFIESVHPIQFNSFVEFAQCYPVWVPYPVFLTHPHCSSIHLPVGQTRSQYNRTKNNSILLLFCQKNMGSFEDNWIKRIGGQS